MGSFLRSARWPQSLCGGLRLSFSRAFTSSKILAVEEVESKASDPSPASDSPDASVDSPVNLKENAKFPPIFLSQKSPVFIRHIGRMVNNKSIQDFKRRLCVAKYEVERRQYKALTHDRNLPLEVRRYFESKLQALPRDSSPTRLRNRCIITGRPRSVYRKFRMSRICLREMGGRNELMGLYKASW